MIRTVSLTLATLLLTASPYAQAQSKKKPDDKPKAKVTLLSSVDGVVPGEPFDVAIHFQIVKNWHIYWQNSGESGQPPRIKWKLPPGFSAGPFRYPVPKRHTDPSGYITTNIIEGNPSLLVRITPPKTIASDRVTLAGDLRYLVCDKICLQETAKVSLTLPVRSSPAEVKPANQQIFDAARKALPATQSDHVSISATVKPPAAQLKPGTMFELLVTVGIADGYRIFAHDPGVKNVTAADLFVERVPGLFIDPAEYPEGTVRQDARLGSVREYTGAITIRVPGEVDVDVQPPFTFGGILKFQACDAGGRCAEPEALEWHYNPFEPAGDAPGHHSSAASQRTDSSAATGSVAPGNTEPQSTGAISADATEPSKTNADTKTSASTAPSPEDPNDAAASTAPAAPVSGGDGKHLLYWLALAFLGGLILNVMPCVLPVISIKVLSFVQQSNEEPGRVIRLGLTFCLGMLISFWALAGVIIALKATGDQLGWGFQFQSPRFVIFMMAIMFVFGLSLLGVFNITLPGMAVSKLSAAEEHEGYLGAFMKGVLGTILATPCTAPYLGPALGVAFQSTDGELFAIFTAVGLGMASPFAILSINPKWMKFLPKPGPWMEHFKQFMGFLLMGTVVWLMFTLGAQIGVPGLGRTAAFLVTLGFACWLLGRQTPLTPTPRRLLAWVAAIGLSVGSWWYIFERDVTIENMVQQVRLAKICPCETDIPEIAPEDWARHIPWQPWAKGRAEYLASQGYTVYVDYTATWCATCQANKAATLETERVRSLMRDLCVIPLKADFTLEDPDILEDLHRFGRSGVPLNVIYPAGRPDKPMILPEQLVGRVGLVVERLVEAGPTLACTRTPSPDALGEATGTAYSSPSSSALGALPIRR